MPDSDYYAKNRDRLRKAERDRWAARSPEERARIRANQRHRHFGLTVEQQRALYSAFNHRCGVCGTPEGDPKAGGRKGILHIDHDHKTGAVRGLLCSRCNSSIGYMNDSPMRLRKAAKYLEARPPVLPGMPMSPIAKAG